MDRLTLFVAINHLRLRLNIVQKYPHLLESADMGTPFLQGLTKAMDMMEHDLEAGAKLLHTKIVSVGDQGKSALAKGHQKMDAVRSRIGEVEKFVTDLEGSNGGDPLSDSSAISEQSPATPQAEPAASWGGQK